MMLTKRKTVEPAAEPSPAAIAARVHRPAQLQIAENNLTALRIKQDELREELRQLIPTITRRETDLGAEKRARQVNREIEELDAKLSAARRERNRCREPYAEDVLRVLAPIETAAAERIAAALDEIRAGLAMLAELNTERQRVGVDPHWIPNSATGDLESFARRLIGMPRG
jgi:hypothetical protein